MKLLTQKLFIILGLIGIIYITSCGKNDDSTKKDTHELLGAGATFPYPLYSKMFDAYNKEKNIKVNYQSVGSGGGVQQIISKTVDFGASDAYMTDEELSKAQGQILNIPTCLGADVITYNLDGNPSLKFTPEVIANIFLGNIKKWNDEKIKTLNPSVNLPDLEIHVIHRSDGSGTTFVFTDYLSKVSEDWKNKVGTGKSVNWPVGLGAKGNEGVGGMVKQTPGSIGYVELAYAFQNKMPAGLVQNKKGNFVSADLNSISLSANVTLPEDTRVSITNTDADKGYPISSFTWILIYKEQKYNDKNEDRAKELVKLIWWMTHDGQQYAEPILYAKLPDEAVKIVEALLKSVTYNGKKILE